MAIRVAINGFGRIGRNVFRIMQARSNDFEVVAINDLTDAATLAHLLKYDTVGGRFDGTVEIDGDSIVVDGSPIKIIAERNPADLPWAENNIDFVVEATGIFCTREQCTMHLDAGAKKVLLTVPPKDEIDNMVVMGVNDDTLTADQRILSNASCTTNCLAPLAKVLHNAFGVKRGLMNTIHAYTNDQRILDLPHSDLRRARSAACNIIPTSTGAARAVGKVLPELAGKLDGMSMRVPVPCGSVVDLVCEIEKDSVTVAEINAAVKAEAEGAMKGVLEYSEDALVSSDILRNPHSSIFDAGQTMVMDGNMIKVVSWYDNEWGYSNRVCDLIFKAHSI
ncbi:MAG: type I glyceraldehyde-3-phosphate dehydrogenase [Planctomycetota bacterium]|jgi:glyceraldehyde 3-phosphate dehydrogenase|nr:type I glyceraldehyde-3-phosphate dehydrogenase [Planctomycetota bacterium]MDG1406152.1 type I glyceraldehyde-3-phosphate dehydrogenase [Planctomycetota bacterium]